MKRRAVTALLTLVMLALAAAAMTAILSNTRPLGSDELGIRHLQ